MHSEPNADGHGDTNSNGHGDSYGSANNDSNSRAVSVSDGHGNDYGNSGTRPFGGFSGCGPICLFRPCCRSRRVPARGRSRLGVA